ncbi:MAG: energy transducer TonB [Novosphingobium sp.]
MYHADLTSPRPVRIGAFAAVAALHLGLFLALLRAFAPDFTHEVAGQVLATFTVTPPAEPPPPPPPVKNGREVQAGAEGTAGRKAVPRAVSAPPPRLKLPSRSAAPPVSSTGSASTSGARDAGQGSGAGSQGSGTGNGGEGSGAGSGTPSAKLSGEINSARDYPLSTRDLRIDDYVVIYLTIGTDGRAHDCRVARPSKDEAANQITCKLAMKRFRFRPATDAAGNPVPSTFGWQQKWFY